MSYAVHINNISDIQALRNFENVCLEIFNDKSLFGYLSIEKMMILKCMLDKEFMMAHSGCRWMSNMPGFDQTVIELLVS